MTNCAIWNGMILMVIGKYQSAYHDNQKYKTSFIILTFLIKNLVITISLRIFAHKNR